MRRMGKIIWVLIYIAFIPLLCIRYASIVVNAVLRSFYRNYMGDDEDVHKGDLFDIFAKAGFHLVGAACWPLIYFLVVFGSVLYRLYAWVFMIGSLCAYRSRN